MKLVSLCVLALLLPNATLAGNVFTTMAIEYGGDTLAEDNALYSSKLKAGGFVYFAAGYRIPILNALMLSTSIGFKNDNLIVNNGEADFSRFPLESILQARISQNILLGGGLSYHIAPSYRDNFSTASSFDKFVIDFDDALGVVLQANYSLGSKGEPTENRDGNETRSDIGFDIGLRYTFINYESPELSKAVNGDSLGLFFSFNW